MRVGARTEKGVARAGDDVSDDLYFSRTGLNASRTCREVEGNRVIRGNRSNRRAYLNSLHIETEVVNGGAVNRTDIAGAGTTQSSPRVCR